MASVIPKNKVKKIKKISIKKAKIGKSQSEKTIKTDDIKPFSLNEVIALGGDKSDFEELLKVNDDTEELETEGNELSDVKDIQELKNELKNFMDKLGFQTDSSNQSEDKLKKLDKKSKDLSVSKESIPTFDLKDFTNTFKIESYTKLMLRNYLPWYEKIALISKKPSRLPKNQIEVIYNTVEKYWEKEVELYQTEKSRDKSSDAQWLNTVLKSGTMTDKTAALTMLTQESPIHCFRSLESLMNLAKKKARREALIAIDTLRHLWVTTLLPDVKLRYFHQYSIENIKDMVDNESKEAQLRLLIIMVFEDKLKKDYSDFVDILKELSKDSLVNIRNKILGIIYELLVMKPEQEQALLTMVINKLGDPDKIVSSKACYLLTQLVIKHPNMKDIVIGEVERMIFRPNVAPKAQYYGVCFLNQIPLSHAIKEIASKLISIYFTFFKIVARKQERLRKGETDYQLTKMLSALLTGVNRAYPYTEGQDDLYEEQLNTLFKLSHVNHSATSIQALMLIYQVMESKKTVSDRFYQALYEKLMDPNIKASSRQTMLLNLIFKSVRDDPTLKRVKSFTKRLLQIGAQYEASFLCGILFMLSEIMKTKPGIKSMMNQPEEDDEDEHFFDAPDEDDEGGDPSRDGREHKQYEENIKKIKESGTEEQASSNQSWTFRNANSKNNNTYIMQTRNPLYSGAEFTCAWELIPVIKHFHPSAGHFISSILKGEDIEYKGDPLEDFTLLRFLERFMYRNPKQKEKEHGNSVMQRTEWSTRLKEQPVNTKQFLRKAEENVRDDEVFFHRYFKMKEGIANNVDASKDEVHYHSDEEAKLDELDFASEMKRQKGKKKKKKGDDDEYDSDDDFMGGMDGSEGGDSNEESEFDYDNMEDESDEEFGNAPTKDNFTDKDYEEALFSQLNSDGESLDGDDDLAGGRSESMFAAADEFAHILENAGGDNGGYAMEVHPKQRKWEERRDNEGKKKWQTPYKGGMKNKRQTGTKRKLHSKARTSHKRKK